MAAQGTEHSTRRLTSWRSSSAGPLRPDQTASTGPSSPQQPQHPPVRCSYPLTARVPPPAAHWLIHWHGRCNHLQALQGPFQFSSPSNLSKLVKLAPTTCPRSISGSPWNALNPGKTVSIHLLTPITVLDAPYPTPVLVLVVNTQYLSSNSCAPLCNTHQRQTALVDLHADFPFSSYNILQIPSSDLI